MADQLQRLKAALADRYRIERELGSGGMATVYLADDLKLHRSAHMIDTPEPVTKYRESVPPALEQLVMKCLEKKAADRWQSAEELLPQLEVLATPVMKNKPRAPRDARGVIQTRIVFSDPKPGASAVTLLRSSLHRPRTPRCYCRDRWLSP
jgi:serine/threonine protein kinase